MSASSQRPLSPHLQIYRPQLTSVLSISHRATGIALAAGSLVLAAWLIAAAAGPEAFACINGVLGAWYGQILLFAWSYALFYHLCNGLRHLVWDAGHGFDLKTTYFSGYLVLAASAALTLVAWLWAWL